MGSRSDALILFLFDNASNFAAYRDLEVDGQVFNIGNKMFPIRKEHLKQLVTDPVIVKDMEDFPEQNNFIMGILDEINTKSLFSEEAADVYKFCVSLILQSILGTSRSDLGYKNWTQSWDAGLTQLRDTAGLFSKDELDKYMYLVSKLKHKLIGGIYKFGFLMDTTIGGYDVDQTNELDDLEDLEDIENLVGEGTAN